MAWLLYFHALATMFRDKSNSAKSYRKMQNKLGKQKDRRGGIKQNKKGDEQTEKV